MEIKVPAEDQCYGCIKRRFCYLENNEEIGWCKECGVCRVGGCKNDVTHRVLWVVGKNNITLRRDVCEEHINDAPGDCHCSKSARELRAEPFISISVSCEA